MSHAIARKLRRDQTEAEKRLWAKLRNRQLKGLKFKRQDPIGPYIVDFVCHDAKLIVELDGGQHAVQIEKDEHRTAWLNGEGYEVVRFWNNDVLENTEGVLQDILATLKARTSP